MGFGGDAEIDGAVSPRERDRHDWTDSSAAEISQRTAVYRFFFVCSFHLLLAWSVPWGVRKAQLLSYIFRKAAAFELDHGGFSPPQDD